MAGTKYAKISLIFRNVKLLGFRASFKNQEAWNRRPAFPHGSTWWAQGYQGPVVLESACSLVPGPVLLIYSGFLASTVF